MSQKRQDNRHQTNGSAIATERNSIFVRDSYRICVLSRSGGSRPCSAGLKLHRRRKYHVSLRSAAPTLPILSSFRLITKRDQLNLADGAAAAAPHSWLALLDVSFFNYAPLYTYLSLFMICLLIPSSCSRSRVRPNYSLFVSRVRG